MVLVVLTARGGWSWDGTGEEAGPEAGKEATAGAVEEATVRLELMLGFGFGFDLGFGSLLSNARGHPLLSHATPSLHSLFLLTMLTSASNRGKCTRTPWPC